MASVFLGVLLVYCLNYNITTNTQCKLLEHKWSMCASGWKWKENTTSASCNGCHHHRYKECLCQLWQEKCHQHKMQLVTTTNCASGLLALVDNITPQVQGAKVRMQGAEVRTEGAKVRTSISTSG